MCVIFSRFSLSLTNLIVLLGTLLAEQRAGNRVFIPRHEFLPFAEVNQELDEVSYAW